MTVPELLATICHFLDIDATKQNESNTGRPISIVDKEARPIGELFGSLARIQNHPSSS